jgi:hypothetical protein
MKSYLLLTYTSLLQTNARKLFFFFLASVNFQVALTQEKNTVVINPVKQNEHELINKMYQYPQFVSGKAIYKNQTVTESRFNYNYLTNKVIFIDPKGDTLELLRGEEFSNIVIATDTFCYYDKEFVQQLTHYPAYNLFLKRSLKYNGSEKKGAYDSYSGTTATSSYKNLNTGDGTGYVKLTPDENMVYVFSDYYYISGRLGGFYPASKKGVHEIFSKKQNQLKDFLEKNKINFSKKEDLEKLLDFARTVLN